MQEHLGNYFKELIVNEGLMIKDFATAYGTTPTHMSEILSKEDFNTSIIRKFEVLLKTNFMLINSTKLIGQGNVGEDNYQYSISKGKAGRPILKGKTEGNTQALLEAKDIEIRGLRQLLDSKDELIKSKNEFISQLVGTKN
jgi:hypothetical protein